MRCAYTRHLSEFEWSQKEKGRMFSISLSYLTKIISGRVGSGVRWTIYCKTDSSRASKTQQKDEHETGKALTAECQPTRKWNFPSAIFSCHFSFVSFVSFIVFESQSSTLERHGWRHWQCLKFPCETDRKPYFPSTSWFFLSLMSWHKLDFQWIM